MRQIAETLDAPERGAIGGIDDENRAGCAFDHDAERAGATHFIGSDGSRKRHAQRNG
jgi:hypothetical protein